MDFSVCPRCEAHEFESKFSVCMNCNYGLGESGNEVPIPAWVLKHLSFTPEELAEIREINFGIGPRPKENHNAGVSEEAIPTTDPTHSIRFQRRPAYEAIEPVETYQCVI